MMNKIHHTPRRLSVSSWALHPLLGTVAPGRPGDAEARLMTPQEGKGDTLLGVPGKLAERGIHTMELCHFHLPSREEAYLAELKAAINDAGVELWNVLIDDGDLTHPEHGDRDREWVEGWIDTASHLGTRCVRVIAGKQQPTDENITRSRQQLLSLVPEAYLRGIQVMTENWFALLPSPPEVHALLEPTQGSIGLCVDFGNWGGPNKYENLAAIAPLGMSCHAKCNFTDGKPDTKDFRMCLEVMDRVGYSGPFTLVYGEPDDVWGSIERQQEIVDEYV